MPLTASTLVCKLYTIIFPNLLRPNFNFTAFVDVYISRGELDARKYFQEKTCDRP